MPAGATSLVVGPGEGLTIQGPAGGPLTFKARGEQTNGTLTVLENVIAPGDGPPLHLHESQDESWYVLEGDLRFKLDGDLRHAPQGSFVFVPRGIAHCFQNAGAGPARIIVAVHPRGDGGVLRPLCRAARRPGRPRSVPASRRRRRDERRRAAARRLGSPLNTMEP